MGKWEKEEEENALRERSEKKFFAHFLLSAPPPPPRSDEGTGADEWAKMGGRKWGERRRDGEVFSPLLSPKKGPEQRPAGPPFPFSARAQVNVLSLLYG